MRNITKAVGMVGLLIVAIGSIWRDSDRTENSFTQEDIPRPVDIDRNEEKLNVLTEVSHAVKEAPVAIFVPDKPSITISGAKWIIDRVEVRAAAIGADGVGDLITNESLSDEERADRLASVAMNLKEDSPVRLEAFDQWLKLLPEEANPIMVVLARDDRLDASMCAILLKDTFTRGKLVQADVSLALLENAVSEIKVLAREQLTLLTGSDHGESAGNWQQPLAIARLGWK